MKYFLLTVALSITSAVCFAQNISREFGTISKAAFDIENYAPDPDAEALILFDIGEIGYYDVGDYLDLRFTYKVRIKILKQSAVDRGNITIKYYENGFRKTEKITKIEANCYNFENGQITKYAINKDDIYDEPYNDYWRIKRFAIPGVKVGSVIEYTYRKTSPFNGIDDWYFQTDIPSLYSKYIVRMVPFYEYVKINQQIDDRLVSNSYEDKKSPMRGFAGVSFRDMVHEYELDSIPAFYDDEFITSREDYIMKMKFQLAQINQPNGGKEKYITSWSKLSEELLEHEKFGRYIKAVKRSFKGNDQWEVKLSGLDDLGQLKEITNYVKNEFKLNDYFGKYAELSKREFEKTKTGNVGNINLYLVGMMQAFGFESTPILVSTRKHGKIYKNYPFSSSFNYVIAQVKFGDNVLLLDATESHLPFYLLPTYCINDHGLIVDEDNPMWFDLSSSFPSNITEVAAITISDDSLKIMQQIKSTGYDAYKKRLKCLDSESDYNQSYIQSNEILQGKVKNQNLDNLEKSFVTKLNKSRPVESFEGQMFISPIGSLEFENNPLKRKKRNYPVDLTYLRKRTFSTTLINSSKWQIISVPENLSFNDDLISFTFQTTQLDSSVIINAVYQLKKSIYPPEDYDQLKNDFDILYKKLSEQIVLEKES